MRNKPTGYKWRQIMFINNCNLRKRLGMSRLMEANTGDGNAGAGTGEGQQVQAPIDYDKLAEIINKGTPVSYTHLRAHET